MNIQYAIKKLKTLNKLTDIKSEENLFIGCVPELNNKNVFVFKTNYQKHIIPLIKDYEHSR